MTRTLSRILLQSLIALILTTSIAAAANTCVFVGGIHNYSDTTGWTGCGGVAPTQADAVLIGTGTGGSTTGTLTVDGTTGGTPSKAASVNMTSFTGTVAFTGAGKEWDIGNASGATGNFTAVAGETFVPGATTLLKFVGTSGTGTFTTGGKLFGNLEVNAAGATVSLGDNLDSTSSSGANTNTLTVTAGIFTLNGKTVGTTSPYEMVSSNSNVRGITFGAGTWKFNDGANQNTIPWDTSTSTNLTLSAASGTITCTNTTGPITFKTGGLSYGTFTCTTPTTGNVTITGNPTFATATTSGAGAGTIYSLSGNITVSGTWTANGNNAGANRVLIKSDTYGTPRTITAATVTVTNIDLQDITAAGAGSWNLAAITGLSGDCGGNSGITFTTPTSQFWKSTGAANFSASNWKTTSGGASAGHVPLCQDTAVFDASSTCATCTITLDTPRMGAINSTGTGANLQWKGAGVAGQTLDIHGSVTIDPLNTFNATIGGACSLRNRTAITINTGGAGMFCQLDTNAGVCAYGTTSCSGGSFAFVK